MMSPPLTADGLLSVFPPVRSTRSTLHVVPGVPRVSVEPRPPARPRPPSLRRGGGRGRREAAEKGEAGRAFRATEYLQDTGFKPRFRSPLSVRGARSEQPYAAPGWRKDELREFASVWLGASFRPAFPGRLHSIRGIPVAVLPRHDDITPPRSGAPDSWETCRVRLAFTFPESGNVIADQLSEGEDRCGGAVVASRTKGFFRCARSPSLQWRPV